MATLAQIAADMPTWLTDDVYTAKIQPARADGHPQHVSLVATRLI